MECGSELATIATIIDKEHCITGWGLYSYCILMLLMTCIMPTAWIVFVGCTNPRHVGPLILLYIGLIAHAPWSLKVDRPALLTWSWPSAKMPPATIVHFTQKRQIGLFSGVMRGISLLPATRRTLHASLRPLALPVNRSASNESRRQLKLI